MAQTFEYYKVNVLMQTHQINTIDSDLIIKWNDVVCWVFSVLFYQIFRKQWKNR